MSRNAALAASYGASLEHKSGTSGNDWSKSEKDAKLAMSYGKVHERKRRKVSKGEQRDAKGGKKSYLWK